MDLSTVVPCCSGPKRPHDRVTVADMKEDFKQCLNNKIGFKVCRHFGASQFCYELIVLVVSSAVVML